MKSRRPISEEPPRPSRIPPVAAALLSAVIPGLGQMIAGQTRRGLLLLASFVSSGGLLAWRMNLAARRQVEISLIFRRSIRAEPLLGALFAGVVLLWGWIIWDAARQTRPRTRGGTTIFILVLLIFFGLGWQITQIDLVKAATQWPDTIPPLLRVLWPWERAVAREEIFIEAAATVETPCTDNPPAPPAEVPGEPYVQVQPTCGTLSTAREPGTLLTLTGSDFKPNTKTVIWWRDPLGAEFRVWQQGEYVQTVTDDQGNFEIQFRMPIIEIPPSAGEGPFIHRVMARQQVASGPAMPSVELRLAVERMAETIFMGLMATLFGMVLAVPVSFAAARNLMSATPITMGLYYLTRTILNLVRSIEPLIWAIIATIWVGLGPFAGIIALTLHSIAALGKLYSEAIEGIDSGPIEAIQATGANWLQIIAFAVVPQMIPPFVSFTIYRWDINVRMSTIIGAVGGGGIGFLLIQWIRLTDYSAAGIAVWFIAITVAVLDYVSSEIRSRIV
jgi:phosphonate transport system permease protein